MKNSATVCLTLVMVCLFAMGALAQTSGGNAAASGTSAANEAQSARIAKLEQAVAEARSSGDNAWMLTSSALVLTWFFPGPAQAAGSPPLFNEYGRAGGLHAHPFSIQG